MSVRPPLSRARLLLAGAIALGLVALAAPQHYRSEVRTANEAARLYATLALVDHGTVRLDPVFDRHHPGWRSRARPPNVDVAERGGHYYLDKAPGLSLLAVPVVAALRVAGIDLDYAALAWFLALLFSALPTLGVGLMLARWLRRSFGPASPAWSVAPALVLATPWLAYAGLLFSHALAAALVGAGCVLALGALARGAGDVRARRRPFAGGLLLGLAVLVEYPAAIAVVAAVLAVLADPDRRSRVPWIVLGGVGPALVLGLWNTVAFGGPLELAYGHKANAAFAATHARGLYGLALPDPGHLWGLLGSARRGLFFAAPWLLLGLPGAAVLAVDRRWARCWRVLVPVGVVLVPVLISGFGDWHGGRAFGPRYLAFTLPLFGIAAAAAVDRLAGARLGRYPLAIAGGLALSSYLVCALAAYVFPYPSEVLVNPIFEVNAPVLLAGDAARSAWPAPFGVLLGFAAGIVVLAGALVVACRAGRRQLLLLVPLGLAAALAHLAGASAIESPASAGDVVKRERELTGGMLRRP